MTQEQRVLRHLEDKGTITTWEAFMEYGITRLSGKIYELRQKGYDIQGDLVGNVNRYGEKVRFMEYRLVK